MDLLFGLIRSGLLSHSVTIRGFYATGGVVEGVAGGIALRQNDGADSQAAVTKTVPGQ